jgi:predicted enzyme related to lactoylglutathione lyase
MTPGRPVDYPRAMANNLASFAIHADDVQRCRQFYEAVFGWRFEPWGPPDFYLVHTGDEEKPGIQGLLHKRQEPRGSGGPNCFECTIAVDDLDAVTKAVAERGGRLLMEKATIPTVGVLTRFEDTEGNVLGAMRYEREPLTA